MSKKCEILQIKRKQKGEIETFSTNIMIERDWELIRQKLNEEGYAERLAKVSLSALLRGFFEFYE